LRILSGNCRSLHPGVPAASRFSFLWLGRAAHQLQPQAEGLIDLLNEAVRKELLGDSAVWAGIFKDSNKPFGGPTSNE
jgi:hypothetical protein